MRTCGFKSHLPHYITNIRGDYAGVAELADAQASGACGSNIVWVQVPSPAYQTSAESAEVFSCSEDCDKEGPTKWEDALSPSNKTEFCYRIQNKEPRKNIILDSSMVEHSAVNRVVAGSSPARGARAKEEKRSGSSKAQKNKAPWSSG